MNDQKTHIETKRRGARGPYKGRTTYAREPSKRWTVEFQQQHIINSSTEDASGCWNWKLAKNNLGYGMKSYENKWTLAHRVSFTVFNGPIPAGLNVLHYCDNPGCVAPHHLYAGTQKRNQHDMVIRGRSRARYGRKAPLRRYDGRRPDNAKFTGTYWVTDGSRSFRVKNGEPVPVGFRKGMFRKVAA